MRKNSDLHKFYAEKGDMAVEEYDIALPADGVDVITKLDWKVFGSYRTVLHYSMPVQQFKFSSFGKFGRKFISEVTFNEDGEVVEKDLGFVLAEFIGSTAREKQNRIAAEYKALNEYTGLAGKNYGKPDTDMKAEQKVVRDSKKVSFPYMLGALRYLILPTDAEYTIDSDVLEKVKKEGAKALRDYDVWGNGSRNTLSKLLEVLGGKNDVNFDYLQIGISYPEVNDVDKDAELLTSLQRKDFQAKFVDTEESKERVASIIPNWNEIYRIYRDDDVNFSEKTIRDSVYDYRKADNQILLEAFKEDLGSYEDLITEEIAKTYGKLLAQADSGLHAAVLEKVMDGKLVRGMEVPTLDDMVNETPADDSMPGYGISMVDEVEKELNLDLE
jgi:hypothetical protein